jgi:hypothetical protein
VVNKFFYWLRASMLETRRVVYWWADRMLNTERPLEEKEHILCEEGEEEQEHALRSHRRSMIVEVRALGTANSQTGKSEDETPVGDARDKQS